MEPDSSQLVGEILESSWAEPRRPGIVKGGLEELPPAVG
jgi:hypothetical protein